MQNQDKQNAGFPANKNQADHVPYFNKNQADPVLPQFTQVSLLDPSIIYAIQLTNAAAEAIFHMRKVLEIVGLDKVCGYSEHLEELECDVTSVVDKLIDFAAAYAKASL